MSRPRSSPSPMDRAKARLVVASPRQSSPNITAQTGIPYPGSQYPGHRRLASTSRISTEFRDKSKGTRQAPGELLIHFAWPFLSSQDITSLYSASPLFRVYSKHRSVATTLTIDVMRTILSTYPNREDIPSSICRNTSAGLGHLLIILDFNIAWLIRILGGDYTGDFLDYKTIDKVIETLETLDPPLDALAPTQHFSQARHLYHEGIPRRGNLSCDRRDMLARNVYNNHNPSHDHYDEIEGKISKDISNTYAVALPRWCLHFFDGLFLAALGYSICYTKGKRKGRQVNDPSALVAGPDDTGALNSHLDKKDPEDCPPVQYQTAQQRVWRRAYNLRVSHPEEDIIIYKDDITSAFRRVRYHPDASAQYTFVFRDLLIVPTGQVFGSRNAPAWYCTAGELRALAAENIDILPLSLPSHSMMSSVTFKHPPPAPTDITTITPDSLNQGAPSDKIGPQATFVDDNMLLEIRANISHAALASFVTANLFIGNPSIVESAISEEKFEKFYSHLNDTLGFDIDGRRMTASYPQDKREALISLLTAEPWETSRQYKVRTLARILGVVRNLSQILPFGIFLSIHLQFSLLRYVKKEIKINRSTSGPLTDDELSEFKSRLRRAWNKYHTTRISAQAVASLKHLTSMLTSTDPNIWSRPISLLIPRDPHFTLKSDACTIAMGGCSMDLDGQWRLPNASFAKIPRAIRDEDETHINIYEFIGITINTWLGMILYIEKKSKGTLPHPLEPGRVFLILADNTSALSWMRYASCSRDIAVTNLATFFAKLVFIFNSLHPSRLDQAHLAGKLNIEADALSRPQDFPTYSLIFEALPHLRNVRPYRIPRKLILILNGLLTSPSIVETSDNEIKRLLAIEPSSLSLTSTNTWQDTRLT